MESRQAQIDFDLEWTRKMYPMIQRLLVRNAGVVMNIREATPKEDMTQGFDLVLEMSNKQIAVRCRKPLKTGRYRDLTIRSKVPNPNAATEIHKIREGKGDLYFYCWTDGKAESPNILEYMIVDLHKARKSGLFNDDRVAKVNRNKDGVPDGTEFYTYSRKELSDVNSLIVYEDLSTIRYARIKPHKTNKP